MTPSPTLVQQPKQGRRHHLVPRYPDEVDEYIPLQCRAQLVDDNGSDDDLPPLNLNINPELSADERAAIVRASAGMNDVFSDTP